MNIAFFHHTLNVGSGIDTVIYELASRISNRANVKVFCFKTDYDKDECKFELVEAKSNLTNSVNRIMAFAPFILDKFGNLKNQLNDFDVLNTHHYPANYISRNLNGPIKIVTEWSGVRTNMFSSVKEKLFISWLLHANKIGVQHADEVLAPCNFVKNWIKREYKVDAVTMYLDGINFQIFDKQRVSPENFYKLHPYLQGKKIILFVGRITESKNIHLLIDAFLIVRKSINEAVLVIVGNYASYGYYYKKLREKIKKEKMDKDIIFTGVVSWEDLPKYFSACSVYATCSAWEGFLRAEAFAFCKPIVCFDAGANSETVEDGQNGFLVRNYDVVEFANRLRILLDSEVLRNKYGENGYRWAKAELDFDSIADNFLDFCFKKLRK